MHRIVTLPMMLLTLSLLPAMAIAGELESGDAALQAGKTREAFNHYMAAYGEALAANDPARVDSLRLKVVAAVALLNPPPAVPDEVYLREGAAEAAVRLARSPQEFKNAAEEYLAAIRLAPWLTADYFNLGVVLEKAGDPEQAIRYLKLYLQLAPNAPDTIEVKKRIGGLQYAQSHAGAEAQLEQQRQQQQAQLAAMAGLWQAGPSRYRVTLAGNQLTIELAATWYDNGWHAAAAPIYNGFWRGTVENGRFSGSFTQDWSQAWGNGSRYERSCSGTVDVAARTISLHYRELNPAGIAYTTERAMFAAGFNEQERDFSLTLNNRVGN